MKTSSLRPVTATLLGVLGIAAGAARADVTIVRTTSVDGAGSMSFANMTGTSTTIISGSRSRTENDVKMQSKLVGFLARNALGPSADIVLLDDDRILHLNLNKKEYTETSFEQQRAQLRKAMEQGSDSQKSKQQPSAVDTSKCVWLPPKVSVNRTGEKAQFAGFDSERTVITAAQPCQDKDTGSICEVALILDEWLSGDFSDSAEVRKYYSAYAARMGMDAAGMQDASERARAMFSQYKDIWSQVATKMQGMKGYPVRSGFTLALGGAQCKDPKAQPNQANGADDSQDSSGGLAGAVAGRLGGLFHRKSDADSSAPRATSSGAPVPLPPGDVALMTVSSQLVSVSADSVGADVFAVPAGFRKLEAKAE
ncbi:MAG TPA: hypothetical protein VMF03_10660 [Steroidobacteraceae bacterium]|nr:hypothetical protein [Steroidobacteraceae bacterium]